MTVDPSMSTSTISIMDRTSSSNYMSFRTYIGPLDACGARWSVVTNETAFDPPKWAVLRG